MNSFGLILFLLIISTRVHADGDRCDGCPPFQQCPKALTEQQSINAVIYLNGGTFNDNNTMARVCTWNKEFSSKVLSVDIKVGADVIDENGQLRCNDDTVYGDCSMTFKYACVSYFVDNFYDFMCCPRLEKLSFDECLAKSGVAEQVEACLNGQDPNINPEDLVRSNMEEVRKCVSQDDTEPYIFFNKAYDTCTSFQAGNYWAESICKMLSQDVFNSQTACKNAFG